MSEQPARPLAGRRALVTGATRGIGLAVATALAGAGADIVVSARNPDEVQAVASALSAAHDVRSTGLAANLRETRELEQLAEDGWAAFDGLDLLVNNAGISIPEPVVDIDADHWDVVMAINLRAAALLAARVGRRMADRGSGKIINIASMAALRPLRDHYGYCVSKAGLVMATKMLALELGPHGVQANVVCPTVVMTEMGQRVWGEEAKAAPMLARIPAGHFADPADVAAAVLFLASPGADMINGVELPVDGGYAVS